MQTFTPTIPLTGAFGNSGSSTPFAPFPIQKQQPSPGAPNPAGLASAMTTAASGKPPVPIIAPNLSNSLSSALASLSGSLSRYGASLPTIPRIPGTTPAALTGSPVTAPSGATVDQNTGSLLGGLIPTAQAAGAPAIPNTNPDGTPFQGNYTFDANGNVTGQAPSTPPGGGAPAPSPAATPITPGVPGGGVTTPIGSNSLSVQDQLAALQKAMQVSPEEQAAETALGNLNSSYNQAYVNAEGQPIPLPFITGQQNRAYQTEQGLAAPLEAQVGIEQAKRQAAITASQAGLTAATTENQPVTIPLGGTAITPANPQTVLGTGVFGTNGASGNSPTQLMATSPTAPNGQPFDPTSTFDADVQTYMNSGELGTTGRWNTPGYAGAIQQRANQLSQQQTGTPFNQQQRESQVTAATSTLTQQQQLLSNTSGALQTLQANSKLLLDGLKASGLNTSQVPLVNSLQQAVESLGLDPTNPNSAAAVAQFNNSLTTLQSEYNKLLAGSGATTEGGAARASEALPSNISLAGLAQIFNRIIGEGNNKVGSINTQIGTLNKQLNPYNFSSAPSTGSNFGTAGSAAAPKGGASIWNW